MKPKKLKNKDKMHIEGDEALQHFEEHTDEWVEVSKEEQDALRKRLKPSRETRISIRVSEDVLSKIRKIAEEEGLPYQTLINSYLHKLAKRNDELAEIRAALKSLEDEVRTIQRKSA